MKNSDLAQEIENDFKIMEMMDLDKPIHESASNAPEEMKRIVQRNQEERYPTACGVHPKYGWVVVTSGGQGPCLEYIQNDTRESQ